MRRHARGLIAALEQEEVAATAAAAAPAQPEVDLAAPIIDHSDTVETGLMEIADAEADAAAVGEQTEEAAEIATALESIAVCLKAAAGNGGLSKDGAAAVNIAVAHMSARVGIPHAVRSMPALESYGSVSSRVTATTLALESIENTARKIWYAIVDALKKSIAWLTERFHLFFGTAEKLQKRADELAAKAEKVTGEAKEKELDKSALAAGLHVGGKVENLAGHLESLHAGVVGAAEKIPGLMDLLSKAAESKNMGEFTPVWTEIEAKLPETTGFKMEVVANAEAEGIRKPLEGVQVSRSAELPGGKAMISEGPAKSAEHEKLDEAQMVKVLSNSKAYIGDFSSKSKPAEGYKVPVLVPADAVKVAKAVAALAAAFTKLNESSKKISDGKTKLLAKAEEWAKKQADGKPAEKKEGEANDVTNDPVEKVLRAELTAISRLIDAPVAGLSVYALNTGKRALDYVTASLDAYGVKVEGGEKKDEAAAAAPAAKKDEAAAAA